MDREDAATRERMERRISSGAVVMMLMLLIASVSLRRLYRRVQRRSNSMVMAAMVSLPNSKTFLTEQKSFVSMKG